MTKATAANCWTLRGTETPAFPGSGSVSVSALPSTHLGEGVAVDQAVGPAVDGEVDAQVQILPVVIIPVHVLGHPVASHEFALDQTRVLHLGLDDAHAVILQVVVDAHLADPVMLLCRDSNFLHEVGIELQNLPKAPHSKGREKETILTS